MTGTGQNRTLDYGIDTSQFQPGETVSFYDGQSDALAGAAPIVEDVTTSGVAPFTPEPLGDTSRFVFAVISIDGRPREMYQVASYEANPLAPPSANVFLGATGISIGKPQRVAGWEVLTTTADGTRDWQELPGDAKTLPVAAGVATVALTPVDQFGRSGPTYLCDTAKPGSCPAV